MGGFDLFPEFYVVDSIPLVRECLNYSRHFSTPIIRPKWRHDPGVQNQTISEKRNPNKDPGKNSSKKQPTKRTSSLVQPLIESAFHFAPAHSIFVY
jgi:hypothetical protein